MLSMLCRERKKSLLCATSIVRGVRREGYRYMYIDMYVVYESKIQIY